MPLSSWTRVPPEVVKLGPLGKIVVGSSSLNVAPALLDTAPNDFQLPVASTIFPLSAPLESGGRLHPPLRQKSTVFCSDVLVEKVAEAIPARSLLATEDDLSVGASFPRGGLPGGRQGMSSLAPSSPLGELKRGNFPDLWGFTFAKSSPREPGARGRQLCGPVFLRQLLILGGRGSFPFGLAPTPTAHTPQPTNARTTVIRIIHGGLPNLMGMARANISEQVGAVKPRIRGRCGADRRAPSALGDARLALLVTASSPKRS
ncbi:MAG: hypothetical protein ACXVXL_15845 [Solirubrobacteraceae bacterium]